MSIITVILSIILSVFSTCVMSYVALATPIGPWIAPTLVFIALLLSKFFARMSTTGIAHAVSAGSIGGIMATACAFSFPTIYFLDPVTFNTWMQSPLFFSGLLGCFSFLAGSFGLLVADYAEKTLIDTQELSFPIGQLINKMIAAQDQIKKAYELMVGFCATAFFLFLQGGIWLSRAIVPKMITVMQPMQFLIFSLPRMVINFDTAPMIWAIGFVTGHVIAIPLAAGACANVLLLNPLQRSFFSYLSVVEFTLAFCSGIVLYITAMSVVAMPKQIIGGVKKWIASGSHKHIAQSSVFSVHNIGITCVLGAALIVFFSYFKFPLHVQVYLIVCSIITTYQIAAIAGRIGLALLGRFATFVMVPAMLMFNINYVHMVLIATFVEISGGTAADVLFGRKLAQLSGISRATMRRYQLLGLVICSASIGIIFWLLINHFGLGSPELFAYRAQSRQLLIQAQQFNYTVVAIGALFGLLLQKINLNPMLVLGGLLMPLDITFGLVVGGLLAMVARDKEQWYPFWSGVFASNSIIMLLRAIFT
jgi:hypothetical protein